ncbi:N-methyltryptophan oxidase [Agrobacterium sp. DSM 25558]|uniref:NAD(P)/FAD-dependent oxidoreductase n=1 Tax=Agrobacterium sp. DSM 25558 TaxID=1907665 RepID=UPI00097255B7|nr:FAD-binding oxidoreductase [Agrobacterium sp. DSM 25558]SCX22969.1 N-methyltryptophan oxidase [Agrobacterium sp. DSM 25558]
MKNSDTFDLVVIGGGVIGTGVAWFAIDCGARVALVERLEFGTGGATAVSGGILRAFDRDKTAAQAARHGMEIFRNWKTLGLPGETGYCAAGSVYLLDNDSIQSARVIRDMLHSEPYPVEFVEAQRLNATFKWLKGGAWGGAIYEMRGGYGSPRQTAKSLAEAALARGLEYFPAQAVARVEQNGDRLSVITDRSVIQGANVIVCGGAGTEGILARSGLALHLDQRIRPRAIGVPSFDGSQESVQLECSIVDEVNITYVRPLGGMRYMVGANLDRWVDDPHSEPSLTCEQVSDGLERGGHVANCLDQAVSTGGVCGVDGYTASRKPVVGRVEGCNGLFVASGFSGGGYKVAPYVAAVIATEIVGPLRSASLRIIVKNGLGEFAQRPALAAF